MTYLEKLEALEAAMPDHRLLRVFRLMQTAGNEMLLDLELKKIPPAEEEPDIEDDDPDEVEDERLRRLRMEQSNLFVDRRKLSNTLHDCANDRQRAAVSEKIQIVQQRIEMVRQQIREYKETGMIAEPDEKYPIPEDGIKLSALRLSLRASISRKKKELLHLAREAAEGDTETPAKIEKAEAKLRDLKIHLAHVQKALADRNI